MSQSKYCEAVGSGHYTLAYPDIYIISLAQG
jgi:hypothetical protein